MLGSHGLSIHSCCQQHDGSFGCTLSPHVPVSSITEVFTVLSTPCTKQYPTHKTDPSLCQCIYIVI